MISQNFLKSLVGLPVNEATKIVRNGNYRCELYGPNSEVPLITMENTVVLIISGGKVQEARSDVHSSN